MQSPPRRSELCTTVHKVSWCGSYARVLSLTSKGLRTSHPDDRRTTNHWPDAALLHVSHAGCRVELVVAGLCGFPQKQLFELPSIRVAKAVSAAIAIRIVRCISPEDTAIARSFSAEAAVLAAEPAPAPSGISRTMTTDDDQQEDFDVAASPPAPEPAQLHFDVCVTVIKGRLLQRPPPLCGNPVIDCLWGAPGDESPAGSSSNLAPGPSEADGALEESAESTTDAADLADVADGSRVHGAPVRWSTAEADDDASSPRWNYEACFAYRATHAELKSRTFSLQLVHRRWALSPIVLGSVRISLWEIASGPMKFDLPIVDTGMPARLGPPPGPTESLGRLVFSVEMVQRCDLMVSVPHVAVVMRALTHHTSRASLEASHRETTYGLSVAVTMGEEESLPTRADFDADSLLLTESAQVQHCATHDATHTVPHSHTPHNYLRIGRE